VLTVFVPSGGPNQIIGRDGKTYNARLLNGRLVIDIPLNLFQAQLAGKQGLRWQAENYEAMEFLGANQSSNFMINNAFPGAGRPAPAPVAAEAEAAPVIVRLLAPEGAHSFSHDGREYKIGKDGSITVDDQLANVLRSHGFRDAA
jgi:hypothetical protein